MSMLRQIIRLAASARKAPISLTPSRRVCYTTTRGEDVEGEGLTLRGAIEHLIAFGIVYGLYHGVDYGGRSLRVENKRLNAEVMNERKICLELEDKMRDLRLQAEMMKSRQKG